MNATGAHPIPSWHLADRRGAEKGKVPRWVSDNPVAALQGCPFSASFSAGGGTIWPESCVVCWEADWTFGRMRRQPKEDGLSGFFYLAVLACQGAGMRTFMSLTKI